MRGPGVRELCVSLAFALAIISVPAFGQSTASQITGLVLSNSNTASNNPFLWLQDSSGDTGVVPLLEVTGGQGASTLGVEVTSQSNSTAGTPPTFAWVPAGFGGLSLVQTSAATSTGGQASPVFSMCANQYGTQLGSAQQGPACWYWQVQGGGALTLPTSCSYSVTTS